MNKRKVIQIILWSILALLQCGGSLVFFLFGNWTGTISLALTATATFIKVIAIIIDSSNNNSGQQDVSVIFIIKPGGKVNLPTNEYVKLIPTISGNIGITCNRRNSELYDFMCNDEAYRFSINLAHIIENSDDKQTYYEISSFSISYPPPQKIKMKRDDFNRKLQDLIHLVKELSAQLRSRSQFSSIDVKGVITVWKFIPPDGVYKIKFMKKLNNLFKAQFLHTIIISSGKEQCIFGKEYMQFVFPLESFPSILKHMADIIW